MSSIKCNRFPVHFSVVPAVVTVSLAITFNLPLVVTTTTPMANTTQPTQFHNQSNIQILSPPPAKSLFNSQLFQDNILGGVMKTFVNSLPLRESYIAFEQGHPDTSSSPEFDEYFKPSKFPGGYDHPTSPSFYTKLQNPYSYSPPPPPLPPSPSFYQTGQSPYYGPFASQPRPQPPPFLRLIKIPGDLKITVTGGGRNDLEVVCEFPPYLLIVQQIYWHVIPPPSTLLLPYGTFYDSRNGFAPRVTVTSISKWKSVLRVRDFSPDDYGTYRCVSTAILPDEPEPSYLVQLPPHLPPPPPTPYYPHHGGYPHPHLHHHHHHDPLELRSAESTLLASQFDDDHSKEQDDIMASSTGKRESKVKFARKKREVGSFGVYAPFFKPHYGVYRVFKEIKFYGDIFGAGSDLVENTLNNSDPLDKGSGGSSTGGNGNSASRESNREESQQGQEGGRRFDLFKRRSKILF